MRSTALLAVLLAVFSMVQGHRWRHRWTAPSPAGGESCTELVRNPERCNDTQSVTETVKPAGERFGPNVCVNETVETVSAADYVIKVERNCRWTYYGRQYCRSRSRCVRADTCTVRNISSTAYDCCAGFGARSSGRDHGFGYGRVNRHPGYWTLRREGCTVELHETVAECLTELGLTDFEDAIENFPALKSRLASEDEEFTVFAPTNGAINGRFLSRSSVMTHILDEVVRNKDLRSFSVLRPLNEGTLLHVTDVHAFTWRFRFTEETFINGAQVNRSDACLAENGVVHTVRSIIPYSPDSIAELLAEDSQFSSFVSLLNAANITRFLGADRNTSRTVFAPTNAAFEKLPAGAVECLLRPENKAFAKRLVLTHITAPVEYTSSLSQRRYIQTFYYYRLLVCVINGTIHLTRDNIPLSETDITARNGVIHSLQSVLLSDYCINYERVCPPAEPIPEPSPSPEPIPEPIPSPESIPEPSPSPEPIPEPSPSPEPIPEPEPVPEETAPPPSDDPVPEETAPPPSPSLPVPVDNGVPVGPDLVPSPSPSTPEDPVDPNAMVPPTNQPAPN